MKPSNHQPAGASWALIVLLGLALLLLLAPGARAAPAPQIPAASGPVYTIEVDGTLTAATIGYVRRALRVAEASRANALIIRLGSGGGVLREIRPLASELVQAQVPVVVYISPAGTQAGAPGAFLASAAHISALAPDTSFGSPYPLATVDAALSASTRTMVADSVADQLRDWNRQRGRSVAWVEQAVQAGAIVTNEQALATTPPAVDLVAADMGQLLALLDGRIVTLANGSAVSVVTLGRQPSQIAPSLPELFFQLLAEPTTTFVLLVLGALAIALEFASPGTTLFAGVGVILLIGAAIGLLALPVQWWAIGLLVLGLALLGLEFAVSTHGGLAVAGLALLTIGALNLIDPVQAPGAGVAPWAVAAVAVGAASLIGLGLWMALRTRARPVATGTAALVGRLAEVRRRLDPQGMVFIDGALWQAISEEGVAEPGDWVRVIAVHRLRLIVRPIDDPPAGAQEQG